MNNTSQEKFYLLTFKEDYNDEFNVSALDCFTQEELDDYMKLPLEGANPFYDQEKHQQAREQFEDILCGRRTTMPDKHLYKYSPRLKITQCYLGNYGEGFDLIFEGYKTFKELVDCKMVKISEVTKEFYDTFHKNGLRNLSLCNIFGAFNYFSI